MRSKVTSFFVVLILIVIILGLYWLVNPDVASTYADVVHSVKSIYKQNSDQDKSLANFPTYTDQSTVPILMFHHVKDTTDTDNEVERGLSVPIQVFRQEIKYLSDNNYQTILLENLFNKNQNNKVVLTFDDGYKDVIQNAYPILEANGFIATVFVITDDIGKNGYLSWEDLVKLENAGWSIGSHTMNHPNLTNISDENALDQIYYSKRLLDNRLNNKCNYFSYPAGKYNEEIINMVKNAGYTAAVSTDTGEINSDKDIFKLKRHRISGYSQLSDFIGTLN